MTTTKILIVALLCYHCRGSLGFLLPPAEAFTTKIPTVMPTKSRIIRKKSQRRRPLIPITTSSSRIIPTHFHQDETFFPLSASSNNNNNNEEEPPIKDWSEASFSEKQNWFQTKRKRAEQRQKQKSSLPLLLHKLLATLQTVWDRFQGRLFVHYHKRRYWFQVRKWIRSIVERYTIYILECENGKYYVGSTQNKKQRFREHLLFVEPSSRQQQSKKQRKPGKRGMPSSTSSSSSSSVAWTRTNAPIRVLQQYTRVPPQYALGLESQVTAEAMLHYGVNNVRGACFSDPKPYTRPKHVDALTRFLGHYNNLNYADVQDQLWKVLPYAATTAPTGSIGSSGTGHTKKKKRKSKRDRGDGGLSSSVAIGKNDRCFHCGKRGHWAMECPDKKVPEDNNNDNNETILNADELSQFNGNSKKVLPSPDIPAMSSKIQTLCSSIADPTDTCFNCGEQGHWAADCPN